MFYYSEALAAIQTARDPAAYSADTDTLLYRGHEAAVREARALDRHTAPRARPLLYGVVDGPIPGWCHPDCCNAALVRCIVLAGRRDVLRAWGRVDPDAAEGFSTQVLDRLMVPASRAIAIAAAEMCARSPAAAVHHADRLVHHGLEHPRWQVKLVLGRAVRTAVRAGAKPRGASRIARRLRADHRTVMKREGYQLERALTPPTDDP